MTEACCPSLVDGAPEIVNAGSHESAMSSVDQVLLRFQRNGGIHDSSNGLSVPDVSSALPRW